jgi:hypothetical protein
VPAVTTHRLKVLVHWGPHYHLQLHGIDALTGEACLQAARVSLGSACRAARSRSRHPLQLQLNAMSGPRWCTGCRVSGRTCKGAWLDARPALAPPLLPH